MNDLIPPEDITKWIPGRKTIDSTAQGWRGLTLMGYRYAGLEVEIPPMRDYMIVVYQDADTSMRRRCNGPWQTEKLRPGSISLLTRALLQTWGTAARRHPVGGLGSIGEMLIEHNHGFGQGRGSNSECSFNQAHLPHDTWLQAPCLGLSFA